MQPHEALQLLQSAVSQINTDLTTHQRLQNAIGVMNQMLVELTKHVESESETGAKEGAKEEPKPAKKKARA